MFGHIFVYRLKCLARERTLLFWMLIYPMVLATLFWLAFSNLNNSAAFASIPVAAVDNAAFAADEPFQHALESAGYGEGQRLFNVSRLPQEQAEAALKDNRIKGYILLDGGYHVVVKESGVSQTILKSFVDSYLQANSAAERIRKSNPDAAAAFRAPSGESRLADAAPGKADADGTMIYFYALLAMAALFGGFWGYKVINESQANMSVQGARMSLAPVHKLKSILYSLCAAVLLHFAAMAALVAYLGLALGIGFGAQLGYVLLACLASSFMGVAYGACVGCIPGRNEMVKNMLLVMSGIVMAFLSGLMVSSMKYNVVHAVPAMAWLNPANLIADAFYSLYYYSTYTRFFFNVGLMLAFSATFSLIIFLVIRRQRYASI